MNRKTEIKNGIVLLENNKIMYKLFTDELDERIKKLKEELKNYEQKKS